MLKFDHSLTCRGVTQQSDLNKRWKSVLSKSIPQRPESSIHPLVSGFSATELEQFYSNRFLHATQVFCSPLTRAIQSALVGLHGHPMLNDKGITLYSIIREIKSAGGLDTGTFLCYHIMHFFLILYVCIANVCTYA
jgi:hypothetical protein